MASAVKRDIQDLSGRDPHVVLEVRRGATEPEIRQAFRRRVISGGHPDLGGDDATFRTLTRARDILLDQRRLSAYDAALGVRVPSGARTATASAGFVGQPPVSQPTRVDDPPAAGTTRTEAPATAPPRASTTSPTAESGTGRWGVATVILALLGPLLWPAAIVSGHIALRRARRDGRDPGAAVPIVLALLYILVYLVGLRVLGAVIAGI